MRFIQLKTRRKGGKRLHTWIAAQIREACTLAPHNHTARVPVG